MKTPVFVEKLLFSCGLSTKKGDFVDKLLFSDCLSIKTGVFVDKLRLTILVALKENSVTFIALTYDDIKKLVDYSYLYYCGLRDKHQHPIIWRDAMIAAIFAEN